MSFSRERTSFKVLQYSIQYAPEGGGAVTGGGKGIVTGVGGTASEGVELCAQPVTLSTSKLKITSHALRASLLGSLGPNRGVIAVPPVGFKDLAVSPGGFRRLSGTLKHLLDHSLPMRNSHGDAVGLPTNKAVPARARDGCSGKKWRQRDHFLASRSRILTCI